MNSDNRGAGREVGEEELGLGADEAVESSGQANSDMITLSHSSARSE